MSIDVLVMDIRSKNHEDLLVKERLKLNFMSSLHLNLF